MKKLFFLFAFMGLFAFVGTAQKKACCASKAGAEKTSCTSSAAAATDTDSAAAADAEKAALNDASIVKQVSNTGDVSYARKEVCATTGKVSLTSLEYCTKAGKFINASPSDKASCTKSGAATKVSSTGDKKACCAGADKGACCAKKGDKVSTTSNTANEGQVKLVNDKANN